MSILTRIGAFFGGERKGNVPYDGMLPVVDPLNELMYRHDFGIYADWSSWYKLYASNPIAQGCVLTYVQTMPEALLSLYDGEEYTRVHPLFDLLDQPERGMTEQMLMAVTMTHIAIGGNCYWHKLKAGNRVVGVQPISDQYITPVPDGTGTIAYYKHRVGRDVRDVPKENIVHLRGLWVDPQRPWMGASPIELASSSAETYNEASKTVLSVHKNDAIAKTAILYEEELDDAQTALARQSFDRRHGGANRGSVAHLWGVRDIKRLALDLDELALSETFGQLESRICGVYRVHPIMAMAHAGLSASTYSNFSQVSKDFTSYVRVPLWKMLADQIAYGFRQEYPDLPLEFDTTEVQSLQPDPNVERTTTLLAYKAGIIDRNEARMVFGYDATTEPAPAPQADDTLTTLSRRGKVEHKGRFSLDDTTYVKAWDDKAESWADELTSILAKEINKLGASVIASVKGVRFKRDDPFDADVWTARFIAATEEVRASMVNDLVLMALDDVDANPDAIESAFDAVLRSGTNESSEKIAESIGTIRDEVRELLRANSGATQDDIVAALRSKFSTLADSRARAIARTTVTATTGVTQKDTWEALNDTIEDPDRRFVRKWVAFGGARDAHANADGTFEDEDGQFTVGGEQTPYPAGPGLSAANAVNCRCITRAVRRGDKP